MRTSQLTAGALALALALSACGNGDDGEDIEDPDSAAGIAQAAMERAIEEESAAFEFALDVAGEGVTGQGHGSYTDEGTALDVSIDAGEDHAEVRLLEEALYLKLPEEVQGMMGVDAPWINLAENPQLAQMMTGIDDMARQGDPAQSLSQLEQAGTVTGSEETEVNGEAVTRYAIEVELAGLTDNLPAGLTQEALQPLQEAGVESYTTELAITEDNLPAQVEMDLTELYAAMSELGDQPAPESASSLTVTFADWGESVDITAPPEDEIAEPDMPEQQPQPQPDGEQAPQPQPQPQPQPETEE
ncbi:hypothetical protein [Haloechinothrix sp. LS1_15]|uniref:hypothetical protein n=1 Tax=Haloechinothrix sp. LS1_15 TaxID=2652248 RepID=UPI0029467A13|nr:hypothetical protein [Haloechinothrix sp. LS1_15]MDV6012888.1 hypothetical protein [Haloechinothrix sp. LS1_15]